MQCVYRTLLRGRLSLPLLCSRTLSATQAATALRPFYFAVHPDLFGQYPKARAVNEESLKHLNQYLSNLQVQQRVIPQTLLFYVRDTSPSNVATTPTVEGHFKTVRVPLLSSCPRETVVSVLRSCNLSLDYVNSVNISVQPTVDGNRPIKWDSSYYTFWGIPNPDAPLRRKPRGEVTLHQWLHKNLQKSLAKINAMEPVREQTEILRQRLIDELGVVDVVWASGWGVTAFRACLRGFMRLYEKHKDNIELEGHRIVFGSDNGVCIRGDVILRHDDVPDNWLPLLQSLHKHQSILHKIPSAENHLSTLLNGARIVTKEAKAVTLAENYLLQLRKVCKGLREYFASHPDHCIIHESLHRLKIVQECTQGSLHISSSGEIFLPASCPVFLLIDYINKHAAEARKKHKQYKRHKTEMISLLDQVRSHLGVASITCDNNISHDQLHKCLQRLLLDTYLTELDLSACCLNVSHFYSIMSDGEIYIPWNWIGEE